MRALIKHVTYVLQEDPTAEHEFGARCVWGDEVECGAESGNKPTPKEATDWMVDHTSATNHNRYRRYRADYQVWQPSEAVPAGTPVPPPSN